MDYNRIILAAVAGFALAGSASAQTATKSTRVIKETHTVNDGGPRNGANSFTEAQARGHIQNAGFTHVSALTKGDDGIWRGTARKRGRTVKVGLDYKGNVSTNR
jgi:putative membrane protein